MQARSRKAVFLAGASALILPNLAIAPGALAQDDDAAARPNDQRDVITVTAQRREEAAQDVPISLAAQSELDLRRTGADNLADVVEQVPNFSFLNQGSILGNFSIRGITNQFVVGEASGAVVYVDGVLTGRSASFDTGLFGVRQVEVLRGPQGTFFGANTIAGAVNITTKRPTEEYGGELKLEAGNFERGYAAGAVNVPISENLLTRTSISVERQDGWIENVFDDRRFNGEDNWSGRFQAIARPSDGLELYWSIDRFKEDRDFVRQINDDPRDLKQPDFVDLAEGIVDIDSPSTSDRDLWGTSLEFNADMPGGFVLTGVGAYRANDVVSLFDGDTTRQALSDTRLIEDLDQWSGELRLASPVGKFLDFIAGAYYLRQNQDSSSETRFFPQDILAGCEVAVTPNTFRGFPPGPPFEPTSRLVGFNADGLPVWDFDINSNGVFNENVFVGPFGANESMIGCHNPDLIAAGRFLPGGEAEDFFLPGPGNEPVLGPVTAADVPQVIGVREEGTLDTESFSVFFHTNVHLSDTLTLTGGVRHTWEDKHLNMSQIGMINIQRPSFTTVNDRSDNEFSGTASITWQPNDNLTAYAKYSHGFKSGGFQFDITQGEKIIEFFNFVTAMGGANIAAIRSSLPGGLTPEETKQAIIDAAIAASTDPNEAPENIAFGTETVNVYEGGVKTEFADGRARVNLAGYFTDYNDRQQGITQLATGIVVLNVPDSQVWGFEADVFAALTDELTFTGGVGTAFSKIESGVPIGAQAMGAPQVVGSEFIGQRFPLAPEVTGNASLAYQRPITNDADMVLKFDWTFVGSILHELVPPGSADEAIVSEDSYNLLNARLGYVDHEHAFEVFFWVKNLADERYASFRRLNPIIRTFGTDTAGNGVGAFPGTVTSQALFGPPRMWGVTFQKEF
ncbi:MAG: TonB-dependent receptor [Parvularculaceae bacterium]